MKIIIVVIIIGSILAAVHIELHGVDLILHIVNRIVDIICSSIYFTLMGSAETLLNIVINCSLQCAERVGCVDLICVLCAENLICCCYSGIVCTIICFNEGSAVGSVVGSIRCCGNDCGIPTGLRYIVVAIFKVFESRLLRSCAVVKYSLGVACFGLLEGDGELVRNKFEVLQCLSSLVNRALLAEKRVGIR